MTTAYSYIRFSSTKQSDGDSFRRQTELATKFCQTNGLHLSTETFHDLGLSGWSGKNAKVGKLALFLEGVRQDKIKKGSLLLCEKLDRLSRSEIDEALTIFMSILRAGIKIVTLSPVREYTIETWELSGRVEVALLFALARAESDNKSDRVKRAWAEARKQGKPAGGQLPSWIKWNKKTKAYETIPEKAETVERIFDWATQGLGIGSILRRLNEAKIPNIGRAKLWNHKTIWNVLRNKSVIGKPNFPRIVDDASFAIVQQNLNKRDNANLNRGRGAKSQRNLFSGMLIDARDEGKFGYLTGRKNDGKDEYDFVVSLNSLHGKQTSCYVAFPYQPLETHLLFVLQGLTLADVKPHTKPTIKVLDGKRAELSEVVRNLEEIKAHIRSGKRAATYLALIDDLEQQKDALTNDVEALEAMAASNGQAEAIEDIKLLFDTIYDDGPEEEIRHRRERLKGRLKFLISKITILLSSHKRTGLGKQGYAWKKRAVIDITYRNGRTQRTCIEYQHGNTEFADSNKKISLANLPKLFERTNKEATI